MVIFSHKNKGYHSHYVVTQQDGFACTSPDHKPVFDEIVIAQEAQVVPAFIIQLPPNSALLQEMYDKWQRKVCEPPSKVEDSSPVKE